MNKAKAARYAKLMIVYLIGVAVIAYGLYSFLSGNGAESTSNSFYMMFSGLVVATAGSIYGHNKIAGPGSGKVQFKVEEGKDMDKEQPKMQAKDSKEMSKRLEDIRKLEEEEQKRLEELKKEEADEVKRLEEEKKKEAARKAEEQKKLEEQKKEKERALKDAKEIESELKEEKPKSPSGKVVKVIVCPDCGEENKYTAKFCDNCGRKMRP